ncbi:MAG: tRNA (guanosine(46)-N7)-methyltransferase TrmB [Granulosicoccaceae bacterium]|jgi:tRNA (guanine-N7-)-methyltransferase
MVETGKDTYLRRIRSFVRREGRFTQAQKRAFEQLWPKYGIENDSSLIECHSPCVLEIGFGNGASLAEMAMQAVDTNFIGIEVHRPGVGNLLQLIEQNQISNIHIVCDDAVDVLEQRIANESLDRVQLFFPDPWPKKKHHKRRIVQPAFVQLVRRKLKTGGVWHMATDWQDYAGHMLEVMNAAQGFRNTSVTGDYVERPVTRPLTKFEQRGHRLGHGVWDLVFEKIN